MVTCFPVQIFSKIIAVRNSTVGTTVSSSPPAQIYTCSPRTAPTLGEWRESAKARFGVDGVLTDPPSASPLSRGRNATECAARIRLIEVA